MCGVGAIEDEENSSVSPSGGDLRDGARRDGAVGAEPVLDEERLLEIGGELLGDGAGLQVRAGAGGEADQDADRMLGILLRLRGKREQARRRESKACEASGCPFQCVTDYIGRCRS